MKLRRTLTRSRGRRMSDRPQNDEPISVSEEAADWLVLIRAGEMSDEQKLAYIHWLKQSPDAYSRDPRAGESRADVETDARRAIGPARTCRRVLEGGRVFSGKTAGRDRSGHARREVQAIAAVGVQNSNDRYENMRLPLKVDAAIGWPRLTIAIAGGQGVSASERTEVCAARGRIQGYHTEAQWIPRS